MRNKVLLTGSTGFLGKILMKGLVSRSYDVKDIGTDQERVDITKTFNLDFCPGIVIHAAGKAHTLPRNELERQNFYDINFKGTQHLCAAIDQLDTLPEAFVFISSVSVYGLESGWNISEEVPLMGSSAYAHSKILAEQFLKKWANKLGVTLSILRLPIIAGPQPPGNLAAMISGIKSGRYLSVGNADAKKSMVWAEDIVSIIPKLIKKGGTYNLTDGYHPSFAELESVISSSLGKKKPVRIPLWLANILGKMGDFMGSKSSVNSDIIQKLTASLTFDDTKAIENLGWRPSKVLDKISSQL